MASLGMVPDGLLNFFSLVELRRAFFLQCHSLNIGMVCLETYQYFFNVEKTYVHIRGFV